MAGMRVLLLVLCALSALAPHGRALECWRCDPQKAGAKCRDPFIPETAGALVAREDCEGFCYKLVARSISNGTARAVGRGCSPLGSQTCNKLRDDLTESGNKMTFCKTCSEPLCNSAADLSASLLVFTATLVGALMLRTDFIQISLGM